MRADRALLPLLLACTSCAFSEVAPYPYDDHVTLNEDEELRIDVLENDLGAERVEEFALSTDSTGKRVDIGKRTAHGSVRVLDERTVLYTPDRDFSGEDSFYYVASNAGGNTRARVFIEVTADGTHFGEPAPLHESASFLGVWPAMLDRDLLPDLVTLASPEPARIEALLNTGELLFEPTEGCCEGVASQLLVADLDRDGLSDLVALGADDHSFSLHLNRTPALASAPSFETKAIRFGTVPEQDLNPLPLESVFPSQVVAGDFGGSAELDLALGFGHAAKVVVVLDAATARSSLFGVLAVKNTRALAAGDVTGDGVDDVVVLGYDGVLSVFDGAAAAEASPLLLPGEGLEAFTKHPVNYTDSLVYMQLADLDGEGVCEIVLANGARLTVLAGTVTNGRLTFTTRELEANVRDFTLADVDGDEHLDLLTIEDERRALMLYRGDVRESVPGFFPHSDLPATSLVAPLHVVDMDLDGVSDVVAARCPQDTTTCEIVVISGTGQP